MDLASITLSDQQKEEIKSLLDTKIKANLAMDGDTAFIVE